MRFSHIYDVTRESLIVTNKRVPTIHDARYIKLVELLSEYRIRNNISQLTLASKLKLSQPDVSKVERFVRRIDVLEFFDWVNALAALSKNDPKEILNDIYVNTAKSRDSQGAA